MRRRLVTRALGAAAGGLLGVASLPAAVALADDWVITVDPSSTETVTGIYGEGFNGLDIVPPAVEGSVQGDQDFDYTDTTTGDSGTFSGLVSTSTDDFGDTNTEIYVASASTGAGAPPVGSVFDTYTYDGGPFEYVYSDIYSPSGDTITDTLVTPFGDSSIPTSFDAADVPVSDAGGVVIGNDDDIDPVDSQAITSINGLPPLDVALQGTQAFDVDNSAGTQVGSFHAVDTTTTDGLGTYTEAVLVTNDVGDSTVGTAAGDTPAVGSIFNTIDYGDVQMVYSDLTSPSGDVITDTVTTPFGDFDIPTTFDAAEAETTSPIDLPDGDDLVPTGSLDYTGINGLPPGDAGVQGTQTFDYTNADGTSGTFDADVTNTADAYGDSTETVLVTSSSDPDAPAGSVFETVTWGDTGLENVYSDIVSTTGGAETITDTLVTPLGDFTIPNVLDASAGLVNDFGSI